MVPTTTFTVFIFSIVGSPPDFPNDVPPSFIGRLDTNVYLLAVFSIESYKNLRQLLKRECILTLITFTVHCNYQVSNVKNSFVSVGALRSNTPDIFMTQSVSQKRFFVSHLDLLVSFFLAEASE